MSKKAKFVVVEGIDHVGKTTQLDKIETFLHMRGVDHLRFREPGGTKMGERVREILLDKSLGAMSPRAELMLFFGARVQLIETQVEPALKAGRTVVLDRYYFSSAAYQGPFVFSPNWVLGLAEDWLRLIEPDLVIYLDGDPEVLAKRAHGEPDRIEAKGLDYQRKVRSAFLSMADHRSDIFTTVNAERPVDMVWVDIQKILESRLLGVDLG